MEILLHFVLRHMKKRHPLRFIPVVHIVITATLRSTTLLSQYLYELCCKRWLIRVICIKQHEMSIIQKSTTETASRLNPTTAPNQWTLWKEWVEIIKHQSSTIANWKSAAHEMHMQAKRPT